MSLTLKNSQKLSIDRYRSIVSNPNPNSLRDNRALKNLSKAIWADVKNGPVQNAESWVTHLENEGIYIQRPIHKFNTLVKKNPEAASILSRQLNVYEIFHLAQYSDQLIQILNGLAVRARHDSSGIEFEERTVEKAILKHIESEGRNQYLDDALVDLNHVPLIMNLATATGENFQKVLNRISLENRPYPYHILFGNYGEILRKAKKTSHRLPISYLANVLVSNPVDYSFLDERGEESIIARPDLLIDYSEVNSHAKAYFNYYLLLKINGAQGSNWNRRLAYEFNIESYIAEQRKTAKFSLSSIQRDEARIKLNLAENTVLFSRIVATANLAPKINNY